jgi:TonB-dependent SusC/RagA subfamily outer membrane receptor
MRRVCSIAVTVAAVAQLACGPSLHRDTTARHEARLITREEIERSGAVDAFDAIKRAGSYLNISERKRGDIRITERGRSSFLLSPQILLVVDDVMMTNLNALHDIRAENLDWIRVMTGAEATSQYGTDAANGVVVVATRIPQ